MELTIMATTNSIRKTKSAPAPRAMLSAHDVGVIRELLEAGLSLREVAAKFGVHFAAKRRMEGADRV